MKKLLFLLMVLYPCSTIFGESITIWSPGPDGNFPPFFNEDKNRELITGFDTIWGEHSAIARRSTENYLKYRSEVSKYNQENGKDLNYLDRSIKDPKELAARSRVAAELDDLTAQSQSLRGNLEKLEERYHIEKDRADKTEKLINRETIPNRSMAGKALDAAQRALDFYQDYKNDAFEGDAYLTTAGLLIDITLGSVLAVPIDAYQFVIGKDPFTGRILDPYERAESGVGLVTLGNYRRASSAINAGKKIYNSLPKHYKGQPIEKVAKGINNFFNTAMKNTPNPESAGGRSVGRWTGERGKSKWVGTKPEVQDAYREYGVDGIDYREGIPNFDPVVSKEAKFDDLKQNTGSDFTKYYQKMVTDGEAVDTADARRIVHETRASTLHHKEDLQTLQEVPTVIHDDALHAGGRSLKKNIDRALREG